MSQLQALRQLSQPCHPVGRPNANPIALAHTQARQPGGGQFSLLP
tara:strand:- start:12934 stop:13068 length:135 start_codon:yes stop_codon:yes gene_type:complete